MYPVFWRLVSNRRPDDDLKRVETCSLFLSTIKNWCVGRTNYFIFAISLLLSAKTSSGPWHPPCCRLRGRVSGSGTLIIVDSILLLEWYYKKQKQFIINVMEYWKFIEAYPIPRLAGRFRYVLRCPPGVGGATVFYGRSGYTLCSNYCSSYAVTHNTCPHHSLHTGIRKNSEY